jgi:hypothetical protein
MHHGLVNSTFWAGLSALLLLSATTAPAQQPSQAELNAVRQSCRSDFMANCSGVTPGGKDALDCLKRNVTRLSSACQSAVNALSPPPPAAAVPSAPPPIATPQPVAESAPGEAKPKPAATPSQDDQLAAVRQVCTLNDLMAHCSWIAPSNPELLQCLRANASDLSVPCQSAVLSLPATTPSTPAATMKPSEPVRQAEPAKKPVEPARAPTPPASAPTASAGTPNAQQTAAIKAACRSDFISHCTGVQPGGAAALQCLQRNAASLSGACRSAVATIGGGAPVAGTPAVAAPAAAAAPAPIGAMPNIRPREALAIVQICRADVSALCQDVPMGGGRLLRCLAENGASLSPQCRGALSAAAGR